MTYDFVIGIDPGTETGWAVWSCSGSELIAVGCSKLHSALLRIKESSEIKDNRLFVRIENPNTWKPFGGKRNNAKLQGAGSIKRDYAILTDALTDWGIAFEGVSLHAAPKKLTAEAFRKLTGWQERTNQHGRDAAMLCWKYTA